MALVKILSEARPDLGFILIDQKDFNPSIHKLYEEVVEPVHTPKPPKLEASSVAGVRINHPDTTLQDLIDLEGVGKSTAEQIIALRSQRTADGRSENPLTLEILQTKFPRIKWSELNLIF
jgi:hypothetical protein